MKSSKGLWKDEHVHSRWNDLEKKGRTQGPGGGSGGRKKQKGPGKSVGRGTKKTTSN